MKYIKPKIEEIVLIDTKVFVANSTSQEEYRGDVEVPWGGNDFKN